MARVEISEVVLRKPSGSNQPIVVPGASVQVNLREGGVATVYQASTGPTTVSNPLTADAAGRIEGWVEEGSYDLVVSGNGIDTYTMHPEAIPATQVASTAPATASRNTIQPSIAGANPIILKAHASQSVPMLKVVDSAGLETATLGQEGSKFSLIARSESGEPTVANELNFYNRADGGSAVRRWGIGLDYANSENDDLVVFRDGGGGVELDFTYWKWHDSNDSVTVGFAATPPADTHSVQIKGYLETQGCLRLDVRGGSPGPFASFYTEGGGEIAKFEYDGSANVRLMPTGSTVFKVGGPLNLSDKQFPTLKFSPSSGATKSAEVYQGANVLTIADAGVAERVRIDLASGDMTLVTGRLKWGDAGNEQTTVGAAGGASALPATPSKYLHVIGSGGQSYVIPAYAAS